MYVGLHVGTLTLIFVDVKIVEDRAWRGDGKVVILPLQSTLRHFGGQ